MPSARNDSEELDWNRLRFTFVTILFDTYRALRDALLAEKRCILFFMSRLPDEAIEKLHDRLTDNSEETNAVNLKIGALRLQRIELRNEIEQLEDTFCQEMLVPP